MAATIGGIELSQIERQLDQLVHRGPDSAGAWISEDRRVGLGHRRLAIIDLSPAGHQPMAHAESGCVVTFNGEIYNFRELRDQLALAGHHFSSRSDTEVLLHAYARWGPKCVEHFVGMFAFALFDPRLGILFLARDRAGEKPLFYTTVGGRFVFASELKALLIDPAISRTVNRAALNEYLTYGYVSGDRTIFQGISQLRAGERATFAIRTGSLSVERYWNLPLRNQASGNGRKPDGKRALVDELHTLLRTAVRRQLISDVPVGILLSGGTDSSIIAAVAAEASDQRIRTFTVRFPQQPRFDEGDYAKLVAKHVGSEHVELNAVPPGDDLVRRLAIQFDEPIADSSMIPTYLVSREIRQHATVALGGDGGDELFGGYRRHSLHVQQDQLRRLLPLKLRSAVARAAEKLIPPGRAGRNYLQSLARSNSYAIAQAGRIFRADERPGLSEALRDLSPDDLSAPERTRANLVESGLSSLQHSTATDFSSYLVDDVLVKVDRASMLASLEVRAPFLDHHIVEFAFSVVPDQMRATRRNRKILLRLLGQRLLPRELDLRRKQGFSIPVDHWLRNEWTSLLDEELNQDSCLVDKRAMSSYVTRLRRGEPTGDRLFALLVLRIWEREYSVSGVV